ncbi:MAG: sporulation integral membrane protein YtvI [Clostridiales bacterium]|nr:sporulation integral membrane protein YtvI [Clostridiales bacterium]
MREKNSYRRKYLKMFINMSISIITILLVIWLGPKLLWVFMPFVIGWIIALIANPVVRFLEKRLKIVRKHGSALIVILVIGLIVVGGYFLIEKVISETVNFLADIPNLYTSLEKEFQNIGGNLTKITDLLPSDIRKIIDNITTELGGFLSTTIESLGSPTIEAAGNVARNIPSVLVQIIVTVLSSYFFIADKDKIIIKAKEIIPVSIQKKWDLIISEIIKAAGGYFKAQFKIMGVVTIIMIVGLLILQVKYAILLAILISILDFLPLFGTGTALIPWAIVKFLSGDYQMAIWLLIIYGITQLVRQLIQPKIVGDSLGLNPLLTLFLMYIGFKVRGLAGMIIAVPIGLIVIKFYELGFFDSLIGNIKEIINDINDFRKRGE